MSGLIERPIKPVRSPLYRAEVRRGITETDRSAAGIAANTAQPTSGRHAVIAPRWLQGALLSIPPIFMAMLHGWSTGMAGTAACPAVPPRTAASNTVSIRRLKNALHMAY